MNQRNFTVDLIYKRSNRKIYLRVKNGVVYITTPVKLSLSKIEEMIDKNFSFILNHMSESMEIDNKIHFLGKVYDLKIESSIRNHLIFEENALHIFSKSPLDTEKLIQGLYKNALIKFVESYACEIFQIFDMPKDVTFKYKNAKGYYGECFPKKKIIILSTKLAKYEPRFIKSVLYHECAHFKYQNHQKEFYDYLEKRYPNYKSVQKELRKIKYLEKY